MALSDLKNVDWGATMKLAGFRGFAAALVLTLIGAAIGAFHLTGVGGAFRFLLLWTLFGGIGGICYIGILNLFAATLGQMGGIVQLVIGLMRLCVIVAVAIGDPLVYVLNRQVPHLLDLADFKLFNLVAVIFVQKHQQPSFEDRLHM